MSEVKQSERKALSLNFVRSSWRRRYLIFRITAVTKKVSITGGLPPVAYMILAKLALNAEVYAVDNPTDGNRPAGKNIKFTVDGKEMNAWEVGPLIAYVDKLRFWAISCRKLLGEFRRSERDLG